jgi:hypothetical protein
MPLCQDMGAAVSRLQMRAAAHPRSCPWIPGRFLAVRGRLLTGTTVAIAVLVVMSVSAAHGSPLLRRQTVIPASRTSFFQLRARSGFEVQVATVGDHHVLLQFVSQPDYVSYLAPARIGGGQIDAKIGGLGEIEMRFKPSGPAKRSSEPQGQCRGRRPLIEKGVFVGRFRFRGERGFTAVDTSRVEGLREESFREVCRGGGRNGFAEQGPLKADPTARTGGGNRTVSVEVFTGSERLVTEATVRERVAGLLIERTVIVGGEGSRYSPQSDGSALISPPSPFSGEVDYRPPSLGGDPWDGTLSASFPGVGVVRLAGKQFSVSRSS